MITARRAITYKSNFEMLAWKYMRLSAILLVPMVWVHALINTLMIGAENINLSFVAQRWANTGWRIYDILLLAFAFSHGVNGLRQVLMDFSTSFTTRRAVNILLFLFWALLTLAGASAIFGGVTK